MSLIPRTAALLAALALAGPAAASSSAPEAGPSAEDAATEYTIAVSAAPIKVGAEGVATVQIKTAGGYHWNKEYPAKASIAGAALSTVTAKKLEFKQLAGDFEAEETVAMVKIPLTGKAAGQETMSVETRFSVCSDKVCLIKKATVEIPLSVTN